MLCESLRNEIVISVRRRGGGLCNVTLRLFELRRSGCTNAEQRVKLVRYSSNALRLFTE